MRYLWREPLRLANDKLRSLIVCLLAVLARWPAFDERLAHHAAHFTTAKVATMAATAAPSGAEESRVRMSIMVGENLDVRGEPGTFALSSGGRYELDSGNLKGGLDRQHSLDLP